MLPCMHLLYTAEEGASRTTDAYGNYCSLCGSLKKTRPHLVSVGTALWIPTWRGGPPVVNLSQEKEPISLSCGCKWWIVCASEGAVAPETKNLILSCRNQQNAIKPVCSEHGQIPLCQRTGAVFSKMVIMVGKIQYLNGRKNLGHFHLSSFPQWKEH